MAGQAWRVRTAGLAAALLRQRRLWFLHRLEGASATYNIPVGLRLRGRSMLRHLRSACDVVLRHESLRTVLLEQHGEPCQHILAPPRCLACCRHAQSPDALQADLAGAACQGFDLACELPLRATLFTLALMSMRCCWWRTTALPMAGRLPLLEI